MKKQQHREVKQLVQGDTAKELMELELNTESLVQVFMVSIIMQW